MMPLLVNVLPLGEQLDAALASGMGGVACDEPMPPLPTADDGRDGPGVQRRKQRLRLFQRKPTAPRLSPALLLCPCVNCCHACCAAGRRKLHGSQHEQCCCLSGVEESYLLHMRLSCQHKSYNTFRRRLGQRHQASRVDEESRKDKERQVHVPGCTPADCPVAHHARASRLVKAGRQAFPCGRRN